MPGSSLVPPADATSSRRACPPSNGGQARRLTVFELLDAVAQAGRLLVVFLIDRFEQLLAELDQLRLGLLVVGLAARRLAAMARLTVDVLQQRSQLLAEFLVVVRAAQPAGVAELDELDAA